MLIEQRPQPNNIDPERTADLLVLYKLQPARLTGRQFGTGEYGEFSINSFTVQKTVEGV